MFPETAAVVVLVGAFALCTYLILRSPTKTEAEIIPCESISCPPPSVHTFLQVVQMSDTLEGMGTEHVYDYANDEADLDARLGRCYELAGKAFISLNSIASLGVLPEPVALVHGKWRGPTQKEPIGHAIVVLKDGRVWEPITRAICNQSQFLGYTRFQPIVTYQRDEARRMMNRTENYGPWYGRGQ